MRDPRENRTYSKEFKEFMAKQVILDGKKMVDIARDNDIAYASLKRWVSALREERRLSEKERQENLYTATEYKAMFEEERRRREEAQEELEILKKALHIFNRDRG